MKSIHNISIRVRTFVLGGNHGQLLQAYGMKCLLESLFPMKQISHDLYHNHFLKEIYIHTRNGSIVKFIALIIWWFKLLKFSSSKSKRYLTVFGSDTIWMNNHPVAKNDNFYFGSDLTSGLMFAFSVSNAGSAYPKDHPVLGAQLQKFHFISVRDRSTQQFVFDVTGEKVPITCDPAFFIAKSFFITKSNIIRKGVSVYSSHASRLREDELQQIHTRFSEECSNNIHYVGYFPKGLGSFSGLKSGPAEVLQGIYSSRILVTDTFHGLIMAMMTGTPFLLIKTDIVLARLDSPILDFFDKRRLIERSNLKSLIGEEWVYDFADLKDKELNEFIDRSKEIFRECVEKIDQASLEASDDK